MGEKGFALGMVAGGFGMVGDGQSPSGGVGQNWSAGLESYKTVSLREGHCGQEATL